MMRSRSSRSVQLRVLHGDGNLGGKDMEEGGVILGIAGAPLVAVDVQNAQDFPLRVQRNAHGAADVALVPRHALKNCAL